MAVSHAFPSPEPRDDERYYLPPRILAAVRREAVAGGADEWASYAQDKLDRELRACSLLLTDDHVLLIPTLLRARPDVPERRPAHGVSGASLSSGPLTCQCATRSASHGRALGASAHAPRPPRGCLALAVWPAALVGFWTLAWTLAQWALGILPLLVHR